MLVAKQHTNWAQKYRPQQLEDMVLPSAVMKKLTSIRDNYTGLHLLLHGSAGTGKTTAAKLINPDGNYYLNCSLDNSLHTVETIARNCTSRMIYDGLRIVILDEADYLTDKAQAALRGVIENCSSENLFVFTANDPSKLIGPLHSRLHAINFSHISGNADLIKSMVDRVINIHKNEGVEANRTIVETVVRECYPDMRKVLMRLQAESLLIN
jgi:replication factor C small subunit